MIKVDHTKCANIQKCARSFYFRDVRHLVNTGRRAPLEFGSGIHEACDQFFLGKPVEDAIEAFRKLVPEDLDEKRTVATGEAIIRDYYREYAEQPFEVISVEGMYHTELPGSIDYYGKIDKVLKWHYGISAMDHKTTSIYLAQYTKMAEYTHQFPGYAYILREQYGDEAHDFLVDAIHVPRALKSGEVKTQFTRIPINYTDHHFDEWKTWVTATVGLMNQCEDNNTYPQERARCSDFNSTCEYAELCALPMSHEAQGDVGETTEGFEIEPWEPWNEGGSDDSKASD